MENQSQIRSLEKKYSRLQIISFYSTMLGTMLGCIAGNYIGSENTKKKFFDEKSSVSQGYLLEENKADSLVSKLVKYEGINQVGLHPNLK